MRKMLTYIGIALAVAAVFAGLYFTERTRSGVVDKSPEAAIPYQIDRYEAVEPALIGYRETGQIKPALSRLRGLACGPDNAVYVTGDARLLIFDPAGTPIADLELGSEAKCLAVSPDHLLYLGMKNEIRVIDRQGQIRQSWQTGSENSVITSIAVGDKDVFVADAVQKVVLHYDRAGELLNRIGEADRENGRSGFILPSLFFDLALDDEGFLWVVNPGLHTLENYTREGALRASWTRTSYGTDGFSGCCNPTHLAILPDGSFVTSEKGLARVKIHERTGDLRTVVAAPGDFQKGTVGLDLAVDARGRVLVLDPRMGAVRVFEKKG
ncbi:MAG TPA: hypothetical protein PKV71_04645 [Calditrichia bacterium]|nr:hypothetical protein [Calditrichota bacterium]HQV31139.1 hypothetical protein [Calditrichia bacterium]